MAHVACVGKYISMLCSMLPGTNWYGFVQWPLKQLIVTLGFMRRKLCCREFWSQVEEESAFMWVFLLGFVLPGLFVGSYV